MRQLTISVALSLLILASACNRKAATPSAPSSPAASAAAAPAKTLHVYTWSNYFNPETITRFEAASGAHVEFSYFSSNEELMAKLQAGAKGYDVIVPSGYVVKALTGLNLLMPLQSREWPELKTLMTRFKAPPYDPQHEVTVPYAWGTTGLAVNKAKVKGKVDSWAWVFNHPELKGQITMLDDPPDVIGSALKFLGYSVNDNSPAAFAKAKALLQKQKPFLKAYTSETQPMLVSGEVAIAQAYSSDVGQILSKNPDIEFVMPKEGGVVWVDNLAIPKGAESPELAREFMRFLLRQETAALQVRHLFTNPVVDINGYPDVMKTLVQANLFPSEKVLSKYDFTGDEPGLHESILRLWTELKAE